MDMKKKILKLIMITIVIVSACFALAEIPASWHERNDNDSGMLNGWLRNMMMEPYLPAISMLQQGEPNKITTDIYDRWILAQYPVMLYGMEFGQDNETAAESDYAMLLMLEGSDEERKSISEDELEYDESAMHLEQSMQDALLKENGIYAENQAAQEGQQKGQEDDNLSAKFQPVTDKSYSYRWEDLQSYEMLIKAFYAVDSTTKAGDGLLQVDALLEKDMSIHKNENQPQILIYHTHSQEGFVDSAAGDESASIVGVGDYLTSILREQYGYNVLHNTESYDLESRDYAYSNSLPALEQLLEEYPSIEVVIDLHRDAMPEDRRLVVDIQGRPTAQFMFFNGLSRTTKGNIEYLDNPYLEDNLAFSFQMQTACNEYYPGLARRIYLKAYRYNMHLCPKTLLIELGAQNNTVQEAMNACEPLAHVLDLVLSGEEPER